MQTEQNPLILTLRLDAASQAFFDEQRALYFPPERNFLKAHLTLFHRLPNELVTRQYFDEFAFEGFELEVVGLRHLSAGVAYQIGSPPLQQLHRKLKARFEADLIPQDCQPFKPHITIQNKVTPEASRQLLDLLRRDFKRFKFSATSLDLWEYLGGPWCHFSTI